MSMVGGHDAEDCPKCGSDDLRLWHSHRCQAFFVICNQCEHEAGRERSEHQTVAVWNRQALAQQDTTALKSREADRG